MKKLLCIIMAIIMMLSIATVSVFAQETSVVSEALSQVLETVDDNVNIKVLVCVTDYLDEVEEAKIILQTNEVCGYTKDEADTNNKQALWLNTQTGLKNEFYTNANKNIVEQMNLSSDELLDYFQIRYTLFVTKAKVLEIAEIEGIEIIDLYGDCVNPNPEHLYEEQLYREYYIDPYPYQYDEIEYHHNRDGEIDWTLIYTEFQAVQPLNVYATIGDRVWLGGSQFPTVNYCIYDAEQSKFLDICRINWDDYDGLEESIYALEIGKPIGDADLDGELTILDATYIQKALAKLIIFPTDDMSEYYRTFGEEIKYISDINRDGKRNIFDATAIQLKLAKLD